jgi:hypothetical protein
VATVHIGQSSSSGMSGLIIQRMPSAHPADALGPVALRQR